MAATAGEIDILIPIKSNIQNVKFQQLSDYSTFTFVQN